MHDIDPSGSESTEMPEEADEFESGELEFEAFDEEFEDEDDFDSEFDLEFEDDEESPLSEDEEMELAAELLSVSDEEELDLFLGKLVKRIGRGIRKVGRKVRRFARSKVGRGLGRAFKRIAKKALPLVGSAVGSFVPGVGTAIGGALGSAASKLFEAELEGLSPEDEEFEKARRFVRLCGVTGKNAVQIAGRMEPGAAVRTALAKAVNQVASEVSEEASKSPVGRNGAKRRSLSGRWIRKGNRIVLLGV